MKNGNVKNWIIFGGPIVTMNDKQLLVEAVGIKGDKITAVGDYESVKEKMDNNYNIRNLKGNTLLPGFIDSHIHAIGNLFYYFNLNTRQSLIL